METTRIAEMPWNGVPKKYVLYRNLFVGNPLPSPPTAYGTNPKNNKLLAQAITGKPQEHLWRVFETKQVDWQLETTIVLLSVAEIYSFAISVQETIIINCYFGFRNKWCVGIRDIIRCNRIRLCRGLWRKRIRLRRRKRVIPPALWATGGLGIVTGKLPLSLPSPRALDPVGLDRSRVHITFSKAYKTPSESLQKCGPEWVIQFFRYAFGKITI